MTPYPGSVKWNDPEGKKNEQDRKPGQQPIAEPLPGTAEVPSNIAPPHP
jgi:hypothetical protein